MCVVSCQREQGLRDWSAAAEEHSRNHPHFSDRDREPNQRNHASKPHVTPLLNPKTFTLSFDPSSLLPPLHPIHHTCPCSPHGWRISKKKTEGKKEGCTDPVHRLMMLAVVCICIRKWQRHQHRGREEEELEEEMEMEEEEEEEEEEEDYRSPIPSKKFRARDSVALKKMSNQRKLSVSDMGADSEDSDDGDGAHVPRLLPRPGKSASASEDEEQRCSGLS